MESNMSTGLVVFQCRQCYHVIGDSNYICDVDKKQEGVFLSRVTENVKLQSSFLKQPNETFSYQELECMCGVVIGRMYFTPPPQQKNMNGVYNLHEDNILRCLVGSDSYTMKYVNGHLSEVHIVNEPQEEMKDQTQLLKEYHQSQKNSITDITSLTELRDSPPVYKDKKEWREGFRELLQEKEIPSSCSWKVALKLLEDDPRFAQFRNLSDRKQVFNLYKMQCLKAEREDSRLQAKYAREKLEQFLLSSKDMTSHIKYYRCELMFGQLEVWRDVADSDRRDLYEDVMFALVKHEKEREEALRKTNIKKLSELLASMCNVEYHTTWHDTQQLLLENESFINDERLLGMDKEDALIVFAQHIRQLEKVEKIRKEGEKKRNKRKQRKTRDDFITFLDELNARCLLTSVSQWQELFPIISTDERFLAMLYQKGEDII